MKRKLLLTAVALLCAVGTWAQTSYSTASLSAGDFYLYNVGTGKFLNRGNDFGYMVATDYSGTVVTLAGSSNSYTMYTGFETGYINKGHNGPYTNMTSHTWTIAEVDGHSGYYTIKYADDEYLAGSGSATNCILAALEDNNYFYWQLVSKSVREDLSTASVSTPVDATFFIENQNFNLYSEEQTVWKKSDDSNWKTVSNNSNVRGGNGDNTCAEVYNNTFDIHQTKSVTNGKYRVTCQAFYRAGGAGTTTTTQNVLLYANSKEAAIMNINSGASNSSGSGYTQQVGETGKYVPNGMSDASTVFSAGAYVDNYVDALVTDGSLTIGVKKSTGITYDWAAFDNFQLTYYGNSVEAVATAGTFSSATNATSGTWYSVTTTKGYYDITASGTVTISYTQDASQDADEGSYSTWTFSGAETKRVLLNEGSLYFKTNSDKNITITYLGNDIQYYATALPGGGAMTAGQWYSVAIATAGYYNATASSSLNDIVYTTAGDTDKDDEGEITDNFTATGNNLSVTTYYVKSTSNQTFTIKPIISTVATAYPDNGGLSAETWYVYTIPMTGDYYFSATEGVVYTTNGDQVYDAATTSAAATKVSFTKDDKVYVKSTSAQTVKLEGKFYLSTTVNGVTKWLNKDGSGYTYVYDTGLQFVLKSDNDGNYQLLFSEGNYLNDVGSNWQTKAEGSKNDDWKLSSVEGGYKILLGINTACELFVANTSTGLVEITHSTTDGNIWQFVTPDDYDNYPSLVAINEKITDVGTLPYADPSKKPSTYNGTTDVASHITSLTTALRAYFESNALAEGVVGATNYTSNITNPTCPATSHPNTDKYEYHPSGWTSSNIVVNKDVSGYINSAGVEREFYYSSCGWFWALDGGTTTASMSQTVSSLPRGKYLLTVCGRITTGATMTLLANGQEAACPTGTTGGIFDNGWNDTSLEFTVGKEGTAVIGVEMYNNNIQGKWFSFDNFRLVRIGDLDAVALNESNDETSAIVAKTADVTLTRNISANTWSTFVVPFDIDNTTLEDQFGDDVRVSVFSASDKTGVTFTPMAEPAITANKPVLLRVTSAKSSFTFNGVTIKEGEPTFSEAGVNFVGNYAGEITIPNTLDTYYVKSNALKKSTGQQKLKGFRAYFTVDADSGVKAFFENGYNFDDADGIKAIDNGQLTMDNAEIFNLAGQKMSKLQKGVNIVNGKKVLVK